MDATHSEHVKEAEALRDALRDSDSKSMYVGWLTLASFLAAGGGAKELIADLDALIGRDRLYELGVKRPLSSADVES